MGVDCVNECECVSALCVYMYIFFSVHKSVFECVHMCESDRVVETVAHRDREEFRDSER
jgi:hypothetical protein